MNGAGAVVSEPFLIKMLHAVEDKINSLTCDANGSLSLSLSPLFKYIHGFAFTFFFLNRSAILRNVCEVAPAASPAVFIGLRAARRLLLGFSD